MKKLLLLLFSLLISFNSYGEWEKVIESEAGDTYYIDKETIKTHLGYAYYWLLADYIKPRGGDLSTEIYVQTDCSIAREKFLTFNAYSESMGRGTRTSTFTPPDEWMYPSPGSVGGVVSNYVCDYVD